MMVQIESAMPATDGKSATGKSRNCGSCTLCCKLIGIVELNKPMGQWCQHCRKSSGCGIYDSRPNECRAFNCGWLQDTSIGEEWWPKRSKMLFYNLRDGDVNKLIFHVDPGSPLSWKSEPYYSQMKRMALNGLEHNGVVSVYVGRRVTVVLPDRDVDFGICSMTDRFAYEKHWNGARWEIEVRKVPQEAQHDVSREASTA